MFRDQHMSRYELLNKGRYWCRHNLEDKELYHYRGSRMEECVVIWKVLQDVGGGLELLVM